MDFRNAPILAVIEALFRARPETNKIMNPSMVGMVNLRLRDVDWETALKYAVEQVRGRVRRDGNGVYIIEPDPKFSEQASNFNAPGFPPMPGTGGGGVSADFGPPTPEFVSEERRYHILPIRYVDATTVSVMLGGQVTFVPLKGQPAPGERAEPTGQQFGWVSGVLPVPEGIDAIIAIIPRNVLLVYGTDEGVRRLQDEVISPLDSPLEQVALHVTVLELKPEDVKELTPSGEGTTVLTPQQVQTVLKRLANKVRVIAKPRLTTVSAHPVEIAAGSAGTATARDEGCRLNLAPTVALDGNITLQVRVEVNRFNRLSTTVNLRSSHSAVLSGIQRSNGKVLAVIITPHHIAPLEPSLPPEGVTPPPPAPGGNG